jgi:hypothetical protein
VVSVPQTAVRLDEDRTRLVVEMHDVPVIDQPRWPALDACATPARMSFRIVWESTGTPVRYEDASRQFLFRGTRATCRLEARVHVPAIGFSWRSDPLETSRAAFAIMGEERNGRYYPLHPS